MIISGEIDDGRLSAASRSEEKLGGHKFKDDREMETVVIRWLITQDTEFCQLGKKQIVPHHDKWLSYCEHNMKN